VNGDLYDAILQEDFEKEMLEFNNLRESIIIKADDTLHWYLRMEKKIRNEEISWSKTIFSEISNQKWAMSSATAREIAYRALSLANHAYMVAGERSIFDRSFPDDLISSNCEACLYLNQKYRLLAELTGSGHSLYLGNRRFYYDPMYDSLLPIYYDGNSNINTDTWLKNKDINYVALTGVEVGAIKRLSKEIIKIDPIQLQRDIENRGVLLDVSRVKLILDKIYNSLIAIDQANLVSYYHTGEWDRRALDNYLNFVTHNINLKESWALCDTLMKCRSHSFSDKDIANIISGNYNLREKRVILLNNNSNNNNNELHSVKITNKVVLSYNDGKYLVDRKNKVLSLISTNKSTRFLLSGGHLKNWTINFKGQKWEGVTESVARFDPRLLTGCLTFADVVLDEISVYSSGGECEDSINFLRAHGDIKVIEIENSYQDALDMDFSNLNIKKIIVKYAGNDCVDISSGKYEFKSISLKGCIDKALSIGEGSYLNTSLIKVDSSKIGVSVKDSSFANFNTGEINAEVCYSVFRKKQEYIGATLNKGKIICQNGEGYVQNKSKVIQSR
jgi:hypothetical protein